jgi:AAA domain
MKEDANDTLRGPEGPEGLRRRQSRARRFERGKDGAGSEARSDRRAPLHWHGEIDPLTARPWLVKNLLPEVGSGLLSGQWGTFKSFTAIDLVVSVMSGQPFISFPVKRRGGVLYVAVEGQQEIAIRLQAAIETKLSLGNGERVPFAWADSCPRLLDKDAVKELAAMAKEAAEQMQAKFSLPLALIVVDTIGTAAGYENTGDENDAVVGFKLMKVLSALAKQTGTFVLGLDHFGKAVETGTRGASSKEGDIDVVLALVGDRSIGGAISNVKLYARKRRTGASGEEFPLRTKVVDMGVDEDGESITTLVVDWTEVEQTSKAKDQDAKWTKSLRLLRRTLMGVLADHGSERQPYPDGPVMRCVNVDIVRNEFYRAYPAEGGEQAKQAARQRAFHRAIHKARDDDLIGVREIDEITYVWLIRLQDSHAQNAYRNEP